MRIMTTGLDTSGNANLLSVKRNACRSRPRWRHFDVLKHLIGLHQFGDSPPDCGYGALALHFGEIFS
jgi:hypothetical protein